MDGGSLQLQRTTTKGAFSQPQCSSRKGSYLASLGARKNKEAQPLHNPHEDGGANSDDELIGVFDDNDEERESDGDEDNNVDPDITVSTLRYIHDY